VSETAGRRGYDQPVASAASASLLTAAIAASRPSVMETDSVHPFRLSTRRGVADGNRVKVAEVDLRSRLAAAKRTR
jgi:hypothetical protein